MYTLPLRIALVASLVPWAASSALAAPAEETTGRAAAREKKAATPDRAPNFFGVGGQPGVDLAAAPSARATNGRRAMPKDGVELAGGTPPEGSTPPGEPAAAPGAEPEGEELPWVIPETQDFREHVERFRKAGLRPDAVVGGTAMVGLRLASKRHELPEDTRAEVLAGHESWDGFGAFVVEVVPGSPADFALLQPGDVVVKYAGLWVDTHATLMRFASRSEIDRDFEVEYIRGAEVYTTVLAARDREVVTELDPDVEGQPWREAQEQRKGRVVEIDRSKLPTPRAQP